MRVIPQQSLPVENAGETRREDRANTATSGSTLPTHRTAALVLVLVAALAAFQAGNFDAAIATIAGLSVPDLDRQGHINVADAAVANRVQRVIFTIIRPGDLPGRPPLPYPLAP